MVFCLLCSEEFHSLFFRRMYSRPRLLASSCPSVLTLPQQTSRTRARGGTLSNGKGKGSGANQSGHHRHAPEIVWAEGPDEAPMPAVEMQFDDHYNDYNAAEPPVELPEISEGAICKRMWRMFRPRPRRQLPGP